MALVQIKWAPGFDFDRHLIRNVPTWLDLDNFFLADDDDPAVGTNGTYSLASRPAGSDITSVTFRPRFAGAPANHGVTVDTSTGAVTLASAATSPPLQNFMLEIEVAHTSPNLPTPWRNGVRIHVHDTITGLLLTPDPLVGRKDVSNVRFTILGRFSDGVIGEITDWVFLPIGTNPATGATVQLVELHSNTPDIGIEPDTRAILFNTAGATATISIDLLGSAIPITAVAKCDPPWSTPFEATLVDGAGEGMRDDVPNILFLPEGFDATEKTTFEQLVQDIVRNGLAKNTFLAPYNHLSRSINYWSCFVASPQKGVSVLSEVARLRAVGTSLRGEPIDNPSRPSATATDWGLQELIYEVGLPVSSQASTGRTALVDSWKTLYDPSITAAKVSRKVETVGGVKLEAWELWRQLSDRVLLREVSTAFGLAVGGRQSADCVGTLERQLVPNGKRLDKNDFDTFLSNLQFRDPASGTMVTFGDRWAAGGKDRGLVCFLARTAHWSGANVGWIYSCGLGTESEHRITTAAGAFDVLPHTVSTRAIPHTLVVVAHESAHSFHCGDEYAGDCSEGQPRDTAIFGNVQLASENGLFQLSPPAIDGDRIKWLWPRIAKAGVLKAAPSTPDPLHPETLTLPLRPGGSIFAVNDVVRLRARPLVENLQASFRLKVTAVAPDAMLGDILTVEQIEGLPLTITPLFFAEGSVVLQPRVASAPPGDDILLVHADIVAHLTSSDGPLNAPLGTPTRACQADFVSDPKPALDVMQMATNLPPSLQPPPSGPRKQPTWGSWIVGLYEGGSGFPCGIFHPAGVCLMRAEHVPRKTLTGKPIVAGFDTQGRRIPPPGTLYKFCPVCRYILVDVIDPHKHPAIDAEYDRIYPQ